MPPPHTADAEDLLTSTEVCRMLKISRRTFMRMRAEGKLPPPAVQWGKCSLRWRRADILAMHMPLPDDQRQAALVNAFRHITAAASNSIAAGHHAAAAAAAIRLLTQQPPAQGEEEHGQSITRQQPQQQPGFQQADQGQPTTQSRFTAAGQEPPRQQHTAKRAQEEGPGRHAEGAD